MTSILAHSRGRAIEYMRHRIARGYPRSYIRFTWGGGVWGDIEDRKDIEMFRVLGKDIDFMIPYDAILHAESEDVWVRSS